MTRYELLDRIGVGGMAEIFRGKAVAAGGFEKPVAIKRILPHLSQDKRFVELLIAEAKVLSLLKHRNIVQIFDVGLGDDGQYFLVMEYVDGKDLGAIQRTAETKRRRMPFDLCLHVGAEICEALEHAHSAKAPDGKPMSLVHRDVSPSNILLSRAGEIKLTDFGIAKRAEQEQTGSGTVRGKFAYISPEQARNEHIDPRSDVFSVAIVLWELVTNQRLFSGLGDLEALRAVREAQVRRPSEADSRLTPEIDALLMSALSRDPKRRPTAGQFGAQLQSMRYSLATTVGDPATELAKIIDGAEPSTAKTSLRKMERSSAQMFEASEHTEATVIRLRTADAFSQRDKDVEAFSAARQVIDRFEEEETRLAQLSGDQLRMLRGAPERDAKARAAPERDSSEITGPGPQRTKRPTEEPTTTRPPLSPEAMHAFDGEEATKLVASSSRRTPAPERTRPRAPTAPPPIPDGAPAGSSARPHVGSQPPQPQPQQPQPLPMQPMPMQPLPMQQLPMQPMPMQQLPVPPLPMHPAPTPPPGNYPVWGVQSQYPPRAASPTTPDMLDRPMHPAPNPMPHVSGFGPDHNRAALQPWMLIVGALIMAAVAFAITRALIAG